MDEQKKGELSHFSPEQQPKMVDISAKETTNRRAVAKANFVLAQDTWQKINNLPQKKGDPLATAKIAGIQAAKKTAELIPLCHNISLEAIKLDIQLLENLPEQGITKLEFSCEVQAQAKTGVEMEALVGVNIACLCFYDMIKGLDALAYIEKCRLVYKSGGKSGTLSLE